MLLLTAFGMPSNTFSQKSATRGEASPKPAPAAKLVPLGCVPRGVKTCRGVGFGCLVMFPRSQAAAVRRSLGKEGWDAALDGGAAVRPGETPTLYYELRSRSAADVSAVPVESDIPLDREVARSLGFRSVTILRGEYRVDPGAGKFGAVVFDVAVEK